MNRGWPLAVCVVVATLVLAASMGAATAEDTPTDQVAIGTITLRDELIAAQESLLNTYRCEFGVDTQVVTAAAKGRNQSRDLHSRVFSRVRPQP